MSILDIFNDIMSKKECGNMKKRKTKHQLKIKRFILIMVIFISLLFYFNHRNYNTVSTFKNSNQKTVLEKGIDVSFWQGEINWKEVKKDNIDFAIIRASYGWSNHQTQTDQNFHQNVKEAKKNGIKVGAYHYAHATNVEEALLEADFFISLISNYHFDYPVFYDVEDHDQVNLSKKELTDLALAFLNRVKEAGYDVGLYASESWLSQKFDMERLKDYDIWLASYTPTSYYQNNYELWQYTKEGKVKGIKTNVDLNYSYKYYE